MRDRSLCLLPLCGQALNRPPPTWRTPSNCPASAQQPVPMATLLLHDEQLHGSLLHNKNEPQRGSDPVRLRASKSPVPCPRSPPAKAPCLWRREPRPFLVPSSG